MRYLISSYFSSFVFAAFHIQYSVSFLYPSYSLIPFGFQDYGKGIKTDLQYLIHTTVSPLTQYLILFLCQAACFSDNWCQILHIAIFPQAWLVDTMLHFPIVYISFTFIRFPEVIHITRILYELFNYLCLSSLYCHCSQLYYYNLIDQVSF